jgi:hypothetical protein
MTHRIRRQILELDLPQEDGAYRVQQQVSRVMQEKVLPELERVFGSIAPEGRYLRLDKLEVDLGDLEERNWEQQFVSRCVEEIKSQLSEFSTTTQRQWTEATKASLDFSNNREDGGVQPSFSGTKNAFKNNEEGAIFGDEAHTWEVFVFFLKNGFFPWYAKGLNLIKLQETIFESLFSGKILPQNLNFLFQNKKIQKRFLQQFEAIAIEKTLEVAFNWSSGRAKKVLIELQKNATIAFNLDVLAAELNGKTVDEEEVILIGFFKKSDAVLLEVKEDGNEMVGNVLGDVERNQKPNYKQNSTTLNDNKDSNNREVLAEGTWVENAGLVLLHPYLTAFFKQIGLAEGADIPGFSKTTWKENGAERAVFMLHFLATGEEEVEEQRLVLPKLLCGMNADEPICQKLPIPLSDFEKEEAENLLKAVVNNWAILKNTSNDGLRDMFLKRNGLLRWQEDQQNWLLHIERTSFDLLLEKLPWGIGMVKTAWMREILVVEW